MEAANFVEPDLLLDTREEQQAAQSAVDQMDELQALNDMIEKTPILTTDLALESVRVLSNNKVLEAHYSALSKPQKHQIALESLREQFQAAIRRFFDMLRNLIRKAIAWIKKITTRGGKVPSEKKVASAKAEAQKTTQGARRLREITKAPKELAEKYIAGLSDAEYSILTGAPFNEKLTAVRRELAHDHKAFEFEAAITSMTKWVAQATSVVNDFVSDHKNDAGEFPQKAYDDLVEKLYQEASELMKQHTAPLEKITNALHEFQDEREKWTRGGVPDYATDVVSVMDHVTANANRYAQFTKDGIWSTWRAQLEKAERDVDAAVVAITALIEKNEDEGAHYAYNAVMQIQRNVLRYLPHWIVEMNKVLAEVANQSGAGVELILKTLHYVVAAAKALRRETDDPSDLDELAKVAQESIARIEQAGK